MYKLILYYAQIDLILLLIYLVCSFNVQPMNYGLQKQKTEMIGKLIDQLYYIVDSFKVPDYILITLIIFGLCYLIYKVYKIIENVLAVYIVLPIIKRKDNLI